MPVRRRVAVGAEVQLGLGRVERRHDVGLAGRACPCGAGRSPARRARRRRPGQHRRRAAGDARRAGSRTAPRRRAPRVGERRRRRLDDDRHRRLDRPLPDAHGGLEGALGLRRPGHVVVDVDDVDDRDRGAGEVRAGRRPPRSAGRRRSRGRAAGRPPRPSRGGGRPAGFSAAQARRRAGHPGGRRLGGPPPVEPATRGARATRRTDATARHRPAGTSAGPVGRGTGSTAARDDGGCLAW